MSNFLKVLANIPRSFKGFLLICVDLIILIFSMLLAFAVRFDPDTIEYQYHTFSDGAWLMMGMQMLALMISGLYRSVLRHAGTELLVLLLRSVLLGAGLFALMDLMLEKTLIPLSIIVMNASFAFLGLLSFRLMIRWFVRLHVVEPQQNKNLQRVTNEILIYVKLRKSETRKLPVEEDRYVCVQPSLYTLPLFSSHRG